MAGMFVRYYLELPLAAAQVEQTLVDAPPGWLASLSAAAQERGEGLAARVGVEAGVGVGAGPGRGRAGWRRRGPGPDAGSSSSSARRSTCPP